MRSKKCDCMKKRNSIRRINNSGLGNMVRQYTFSSYQTVQAWQAEAKEKAEAYVKNPNGEWFFAAGTPGTGKTHLCTAISVELINCGHDVLYMLWRDTVTNLKGHITDGAVYKQLLDEYKRAEVLYIDDFFKGTVTAADKNLAFELINSRYNDSTKLTLISSERNVNDLLTIDEAIGGRIKERSKNFYIKTPKEDWRLRN